MLETTPLIKAALNLRVGAGFDVYLIYVKTISITIKFYEIALQYLECYNILLLGIYYHE